MCYQVGEYDVMVHSLNPVVGRYGTNGMEFRYLKPGHVLVRYHSATKFEFHNVLLQTYGWVS